MRKMFLASQSIWFKVGAICGALSVLLGAFGAHGLKSRVAAKSVDSWNTGAHYQLVHSAVLLLVPFSSSPNLSGSLFTAGIILFSGSIYMLVLTGRGFPWGPMTPIGGLLLTAGWVSLAT
mmetsp:Transcript_17558/g.38281  ORF Transcript_17558/g.38281 Transcript_17558/m.38281 type:complete len:120 (-) Transcript_17558:315-674(-)